MITKLTEKENILSTKIAERIIKCILYFATAALYARCTISAHCQVIAVAFVGAAGGGLYGAFALLGAFTGYLLFHGISNAVLYIAAALFVFTVSYVMQFTKIYSADIFPTVTVSVILAIVLSFGEISVSRADSLVNRKILFDVIFGGILSYLYPHSLCNTSNPSPSAIKHYSMIGLFLSGAMALSDIKLFGILSLTQIVTLYVYLLSSDRSPQFSYITALFCGFTVQITAGKNALINYIIYAIYPVLTNGRSKMHLSCYTLLATILCSVFFSQSFFIHITEALISIFLFVLSAKYIENRWVPNIDIDSSMATYKYESTKLQFLSDFLRDLSACGVATPNNDLTEEAISRALEELCFDICDNCSKLSFCKCDFESIRERFLPHAITCIKERGKLSADDLKGYYSGFCNQQYALVVSINHTLRAFYELRLQNRQYHEKACANATVYQYAAKLLRDSSEQLHPQLKTTNRSNLFSEQYSVEIGLASLKKTGERVCGDSVLYFKDDCGILNVMLSDGLGSGEFAASQSEETLEVLEKLLYITHDPMKSIVLCNIYLSAIHPSYLCGATIDLVRFDLHSGSLDLYKSAAADSYIIHENSISAIRNSLLNSGDICSHTVSLNSSAILILCSDGIVLTEQRIEELIATQGFRSMKRAAKEIMLHCGEPKTDDCTVVVIGIQPKN